MKKVPENRVADVRADLVKSRVPGRDGLRALLSDYLKENQIIFSRFFANRDQCHWVVVIFAGNLGMTEWRNAF